MTTESENWETAKPAQGQRERKAIKPVKEFREGAIKAAIWKRMHEGKTFFNVSIARSFKVEPENAGDDGWRESASFDLADLEIVKLVCEMAAKWIRASKLDGV